MTDTDALCDKTEHKFLPEATNAGHCFCDCSCGASLGVYPSRADARRAWLAHVHGGPIPEPVKPTMLLHIHDERGNA